MLPGYYNHIRKFRCTILNKLYGVHSVKRDGGAKVKRNIILSCSKVSHTVDFFQNYSMIKRIEHAYKSLQFDRRMITAVNPKAFSSRFQAFLSDIFKADDSLNLPVELTEASVHKRLSHPRPAPDPTNNARIDLRASKMHHSNPKARILNWLLCKLLIPFLMDERAKRVDVSIKTLTDQI
ncbi:hypothetical protein V6N13_138053 [Hibiscus sabdariffa]|uniref:1-phosphatidylinositol-4-phosphate 5-kinase n=1 Tax=Hibiscus sabdariffa TaxID=183260 RepID=A0ABR2QCC0_9ROSI